MPPVSYITEPAMGLKLPQVGVELGPLWAQDNNEAFIRVAAHTHDGTYGLQLTAAALNITTDLSIGGANITNLRSTRYTVQGAPLSGVSDLACVYFSGSDLWCNDAAGNAIQLTAGGTLNAAALVTTLWPTQNVSTNIAIAPSNTNIAFLVDTTATRTITLPASASVSAGRIYMFSDGSGSSETNAITLTPGSGSDTIGAGGAGANVTLKANYGVWVLVNGGAGHWHMLRSGSEVNGSTVPRGGALTTGNVLQVSGASALTYGPVNLALAAATTGVLPAAQVGIATTLQSGGVQLTNDLAGTATAPKVVGVSGGGTDPFVLGSDLQGNAVTTIKLGTDALEFPAILLGTQALFGVTALSAPGTAHPFKIFGQDYDPGSTGAGGPLLIQSGASHGASAGDTNVNGYVQMSVGGNPQLHLSEMVTGRFVIGLGSTVNLTNMPAGAGSQVLWLAPATSVPTVAPGSGSVLYSNAGAFGWFSSAGHQFETGFITGSSATNGGGVGLKDPGKWLTVTIDGSTGKIPIFAV